MTRLQYDDTDRMIREALAKGMRDYKMDSSIRREKLLQDRGVFLHNQNKTLKKSRKNKGSRI